MDLKIQYMWSRNEGHSSWTFLRNGIPVNWYEIYSPMSNFMVSNPDFMKYIFAR